VQVNVEDSTVEELVVVVVLGVVVRVLLVEAVLEGLVEDVVTSVDEVVLDTDAVVDDGAVVELVEETVVEEAEPLDRAK